MESKQAGKCFEADESNLGSRWPVLEGNFEPSRGFPDEQRISGIKALKENPFHTDQEVVDRIYFSSLLLYALEECNPKIFEEPKQKMLVGREVSEATLQCLHLQDFDRRQTLKTITDEEGFDPKNIPVMQALRELQARRVINSSERAVLDATVRAIYIKQKQGI